MTSPLLLPLSFGFFLTSWLAWRYHVLYFYERSYESNGEMWKVIYSLVLWTLWAASIFTGCVLFTMRLYSGGIVLIIVTGAFLMFYDRCALAARLIATVMADVSHMNT